MLPIVSTVTYLGPPGSFSEKAARLLYPGSELVPAPSIPTAISAVEVGRADAAVVPLENSISGPVAETLLSLRSSMLRVRVAGVLKVELVLAGSGSGRVYSHPNALALAARELLSIEPNFEFIAVSSTSEAASRASREGALCLCSPEAAEREGLDVRARIRGGYTRFVGLEWRDGAEEGERTMILAAIPDEPGSLYRFLEPFARLGVNLTMIYSMPVAGVWRYLFYLEAEGSRLDERVSRALRDASGRALCFSVAGSYPLRLLNGD
ncbi:MAG: hypothetical protein F7B17_00360 [Desulfurococcales archaeon]|nr:hypothetical protein [Desulfurococcales archaeon]